MIVLYSRQSFIQGYLLAKVIFHPRLSSIQKKISLGQGYILGQWSSQFEGHFLSTLFIHQVSSSINVDLPLNVIFHQRSSSISVYLSSKVIFHWQLSSTLEHFPLEFIFHLRTFYIEVGLLSKVIFPPRLPSIQDYFPPKVILLQNSLPQKLF